MLLIHKRKYELKLYSWLAALCTCGRVLGENVRALRSRARTMVLQLDEVLDSAGTRSQRAQSC
eukprot:21233-Heterococcus_DN1.PRE.5